MTVVTPTQKVNKNLGKDKVLPAYTIKAYGGSGV
jgi:hypothetical protein